MPDSLTTQSEPAFVCHVGANLRSACAGEPFYGELDGKRYCVLHFPGTNKSAEFQITFQEKLKRGDYDFRGVWFPNLLLFSTFTFGQEVNFGSAIFNGDAMFDSVTFERMAIFESCCFNAEADFSSATFNKGANFNHVIFSGTANIRRVGFNDGAGFNDAVFIGPANFIATEFAYAGFTASTFNSHAYFRSAIFNKKANFTWSTFKTYVSFGGAVFNEEADFANCSLNGETYFSDVTFRSYVTFAGTGGVEGVPPVFGDAASLDLQFARIENPSRFSFHTLSLRPHWFFNVDPRKFEFVNVDWLSSTDQELERLSAVDFGLRAPAHQLLAIACRHLAVNAEENHRYEEASEFRYLSMEARRLESWRGFAPWRLSWWYWLASGYGERVRKAFVVLMSIWFVSGLLYTRVGFARWEPKLASESDVAIARRDEVGAPLKFSRALTYSVSVMTFQKPEPRPATTAAQTIVLLETILGPVQAALLALAIRRKFMR